jgi:hypothetical protein
MAQGFSWATFKKEGASTEIVVFWTAGPTEAEIKSKVKAWLGHHKGGKWKLDEHGAKGTGMRGKVPKGALEYK